MFSNAGSISFRGKEVKKIVKINGNAILYQKEDDDNVRLILEIKEYLASNGIPGFELTFKTEDNEGNFVPFRTNNLTFYKNNEVLFSAPADNYYEPQSLRIEEENFFNIGDEIYISVADQNLTSNTVIIRGDFMEYVEITFNGEVLTQYSDGSFSGTDMIIDYGDGTIETTTGKFGHTYSENGTYTVKIYGVTSLKGWCFKNCTGLTSVIIPNSVTSIESNCFNDCTNLTSVIIPNSVTSIGTGCFYSCNLTSIIIPNSIISIGGGCFYNCTNLISIILNWTTSDQIVKYNSNWIGNTNTNLKFIIPEGTIDLYIEKGYPSDKLLESSVEFTFTGTTLTQYTDGSFNGTDMIIDYGDGTIEETTGTFGHTYSENGTYVVKIHGVTSFGDYCFAFCNLTSINILNTVTSFGIGCFGSCTSLNNVIIPNSITSLERGCFAECTSLTNITIPNSVTSLGVSCFYGCTSLTSITISNNVTSLGASCFYGCTDLTSIDIPNTVTSLGNNCFRKCTNLTSITLNWTTSNQIITYNGGWFVDTDNSLRFKIPAGTTSLYTAKGYPKDRLVEVYY